MTKRNLFNEINEGFEYLKNARLNKVRLRSFEEEFKPAPTNDAETIIAIKDPFLNHLVGRLSDT